MQASPIFCHTLMLDTVLDASAIKCFIQGNYKDLAECPAKNEQIAFIYLDIQLGP